MKLSIIVLSYNTRSLLQQTLNSFSLAKDWELLIVDNGSVDGSVELLEKQYSHARLIKNEHNLGFAAANNIGIDLAVGEYILLLNSDVIVQDGAIEALIDYLDAHTKVGIVTPTVYLPDGAIDLACHRGMPTPWNAFTYFVGLERLFPTSRWFAGYHQTYKNFEQPHAIPATAGTAMMVRKAAIDQVGMLDERFFFYAEDLDWCKRMVEHDWEIHYVPAAKVMHMKSASGKAKTDNAAVSAQAKDHFWDTMKQFYDKHYGNSYPAWLKFLVYRGIDAKKWLSRRKK